MSENETIGEPVRAALPAPQRPRRRWLLTTLLCVAFFVIGGVCGGGLTAVRIHHRLQDVMRYPGLRQKMMAERIVHRLDLDPGQRQKVEQILRERQSAMAQIRHQYWPKVHAQIELTNEAIRQVLRPDQQEKWNRLLATFRQHWLPPGATTQAAQP